MSSALDGCVWYAGYSLLYLGNLAPSPAAPAAGSKRQRVVPESPIASVRAPWYLRSLPSLPGGPCFRLVQQGSPAAGLWQ